MPQKSVTIVYIPGLGDKNDGLRKFALALWPKKVGNVIFVPMNWHDKNDSYIEKKRRVETAISTAKGQVIVVGESAGASMGLVVASENKNVSFVTICGKMGNAKTTGKEYYESTPSFHQLLPATDRARATMTDALKDRIINIRAFHDGLVTLDDATLSGVQQIVLPTFGHITSISLGITILRHTLFRAVKKLTAR